MANTAQQSVVDTYAPPSPGGDHAAEAQRDRTNRMMSRKLQKFGSDQERIDAFRERMNSNGVHRSANVEPAHQFVEHTKSSSVVEQYASKEASGDQGKGQKQQREQSREQQSQKTQEQRKEKHQLDGQVPDGRSSVVDKYGQSVERTEQQQEKQMPEMKDKSPDLAY